MQPKCYVEVTWCCVVSSGERRGECRWRFTAWLIKSKEDTAPAAVWPQQSDADLTDI